MKPKNLYAKFASSAMMAGSVRVFDEHTALELIASAQEAGLAISDIEMVRSTDLNSVEPLPSRILDDAERALSWTQARSFVDMLAGRELYFVVVIESPWSTRMARIRAFLRMLVRDNTTTRLPR